MEDEIRNTQGRVLVEIDFNATTLEWGMPQPHGTPQKFEDDHKDGLSSTMVVLSRIRIGCEDTIPGVTFATESLG